MTNAYQPQFISGEGAYPSAFPMALVYQIPAKANQMPNVVQQDQFQIVSELLERQDAALDELKALNVRVEAAIKEVTDQREQEMAEFGSGNDCELSDASENSSEHVREETATVEKAA